MAGARMVRNGRDYGSGARREEKEKKEGEAAGREGKMKPSWQSQALLPGRRRHLRRVVGGRGLCGGHCGRNEMVSGVFSEGRVVSDWTGISSSSSSKQDKVFQPRRLCCFCRALAHTHRTNDSAPVCHNPVNLAAV